MDISLVAKLTPVEQVLYNSVSSQPMEVFVKREDLFVVPGTNQCGGKARVAWLLMHRARARGFKGIVSDIRAANSQHSIRLAEIAQAVDIPCRLHAPKVAVGLSPQLRQAEEFGASVVVHPFGRATVLQKALRLDFEARDYCHLKFGLECEEQAELSQIQVQNLPFGQFKRLVVPVGSGMSLAGILQALWNLGRLSSTPILGVWMNEKTGTAVKLLDRRVPWWKQYVQVQGSGLKYGRRAPYNQLSPEISLDPYYEAKCLPFLQDGDLLWIVARNSS